MRIAPSLNRHVKRDKFIDSDCINTVWYVSFCFGIKSRRGILSIGVRCQRYIIDNEFTCFSRLTLQRQIICTNWEMYGKKTDGGWPVCKALPLLPNRPCTVYSFG